MIFFFFLLVTLKNFGLSTRTILNFFFFLSCFLFFFGEEMSVVFSKNLLRYTVSNSRSSQVQCNNNNIQRLIINKFSRHYSTLYLPSYSSRSIFSIKNRREFSLSSNFNRSLRLSRNSYVYKYSKMTDNGPLVWVDCEVSLSMFFFFLDNLTLISFFFFFQQFR